MLILYRDKDFLLKNDICHLSKDEIHHLKALRISKEESFYISDGEGSGYKAFFKLPDLAIIQKDTIIQEKKLYNVCLFTALPSGNRLDKMLDMAVQLGVYSLYPVIFEFSERKEFSLERMERIIKQSASQSRRFFLPKIYKPIKFQDIQLLKNNFSYIFYADISLKNSISWQDFLQIIKSNTLKDIAIIVGPEGGFSSYERSVMEQHFQGITLNENILRIETAVISILSIFQFIKLNLNLSF